MKEEIKHYINELENLYSGEPWLDVTLLSVLSKVNHDIAFKKPGKIHSIAEIVCHIIEYRKFLISQFELNDKFDVNQKASFDTIRYADKKIDNWENILITLKDTQKSLIDSLNSSNDETLKRKVFHRSYTIKYLLDGIIQHDVYHLGQLMLLLKMQKK
jgi:uncharacterized damage-inducible protein DinB